MNSLGQYTQQLASELLAEHSQSTTLAIGQPRSPAQLLAQNSNLLPLVQADQALALGKHASQAEEHQLKWSKHIMHRPSPSARCLAGENPRPIYTSFTAEDKRLAVRPNICTIRAPRPW